MEVDELAVAETHEPLLSAFGKALRLEQWADHPRYRIPRLGLQRRLNAGWDLERALTVRETVKTIPERLDDGRRAAPNAVSTREIGDAIGVIGERVRQLVVLMPEPERSAIRALLTANLEQRKALQNAPRPEPDPFRPPETEVADLLALVASAKTVRGSTPPDSPQRRDASRRDQTALSWKERGVTTSEIARLAGVFEPVVVRWLNPRNMAARRAWPTRRNDPLPPCAPGP